MNIAWQHTDTDSFMWSCVLLRHKWWCMS